MSLHKKQPGVRLAALASAALWLAFLLLSACQPMSREESDRINTNYRDYYNRTRGVPVRHVDK
jgi:hypothetical protein